MVKIKKLQRLQWLQWCLYFFLVLGKGSKETISY